MSTPPIPPASDAARLFQLDPTLVFLNHGSFGSTPREIHAAQHQAQAHVERDPVRFFVEELDGAMDAARDALAPLLRASPGDLAFFPNATQAVATALDNLAPMLRPGDEVLATEHEYPACMNNLRRVAARAGARVVTAPVPFPLTSPEEVEREVLSRVTDRTRIALISHVTSSSGLVLPLAKLCGTLESRGVVTVADGAHGIGFVPLDLPSLGCSYYATNCHKWLFAPKGVAVLWCRPDRRAAAFPGGGPVRPMVLSNNAEKPKPGRDQFRTEFDYVGTTDLSAILTLPACVAFASRVAGGFDALMARNRALALEGRDIILRALGVPAPAPDIMLSALSTIPLPRHDPDRAARLAARPSLYHDALQDILIRRWRIQVPVWSTPPGSPNRVVRISAQIYNTRAQYEHLAAALLAELQAERASA